MTKTMKRTVLLWVVSVVMLVFYVQNAGAQSERDDDKVFFGWIEKVDLLKDGGCEVVYYPIADFQSLMGTIDEGKMFDVKKNNKVCRFRLRLNNPAERLELQQCFVKEGFNVFAVEPDEKRASMVYLGRMKFVKSKYFYYR